MPIRYNSTPAEAFGALASAPAIHTAAVARLSERANAASIVPRQDLGIGLGGVWDEPYCKCPAT
jgi:hypothetical protein